MKRVIREGVEVLYNELDRILPKQDMKNIGVLYIDDEQMNLTCFKALFRRDNFKVYTALDCAEALEVMSNHKIHVVVSDYLMPGINGAECLKVIHEKYPNVIALGLTAHVTNKVISEFKKIGGALDVIGKPFKADDLKEKITGAYRIYIHNFAENLIA